eukprot:scaffold86517_cov72-Cyclotella_meneghiniana.AAC.2
MALFTSNTLGFGLLESHASYYTLAMTCVSPMSMVLLLGYGRLLDAKGPKKALNSYAHLLYAQMWSFLGSIFTPSQAGTYYSYVAGISSIASMIAGASVSRIVTWTGVPGLLGVASFALLGTMILASKAYLLAENYGFDPSLEIQRKTEEKKTASKQSNSEEKETKSNILLQIKEGSSLFRRVPVLAALFFETITFQSLCTVLNTSLVTQLKNAVPDDPSRAAWTGRFYGATNGLSTLFQFLIMPTLSQRVLSTTTVFSAFTSWSALPLYLVAFSFFAAKKLVYVPLDFDSRYMGKEIIAVFANRFGKSGMAVILSFLQFSMGARTGNSQLLIGMALVVSLGWWISCISLSSRLMSQVEAERAVGSRMKGDAQSSGDDAKIKNS